MDLAVQGKGDGSGRHWRAGPVGGVRAGGTALVAGLSGAGRGLGWREERRKKNDWAGRGKGLG